MKKLVEKKNDLITRAEGLVNAAKSEERELTDEEKKEIEDIKARVESIEETLKAIEGVSEMSKEEMEEKPDETPEAPEEDDKEKREERAFENYIRGYVVNERAGELAKAENGAVIPQTIADRIIKKVYDICPVLEQSTRYNVKGSLVLPYYDDSTGVTVGYQEEFKALASSTGNFKSVTLTGFLAGALTKVSRSLVNNSDFDIVTYIVDAMAEAIKRFIEKELLVGTGDKVDGLSKLENKVETAAADAITGDELIRLQDAVKDTYQNDAIWIMSSKTRTAIRTLKDGNGRYLLQDDISAPFGRTLLGKPVYVSDNMPEIGAGNTAVFYGDMKGLATKFSEDINVEVLREKFADEHAVGVIGWFEFDAKVEDGQKIAKLVCKSDD